MQNIHIAICISTWNRANDLKRCLECIYKQNYNQNLIDIYIIDNHSDDNTFEVINDLASIHENITLYTTPHNRFTAIHTINHILKVAYYSNWKYKYIMILDDDAFMEDPMTMTSLISNMEWDDDIAICGAKIIDYNGDTSSNTSFGTALDPNPIESPYALKYIPNFWGACAIFRSNTVGPTFYDESYEIYWNEPDLAVKMINDGHKVVIDETISVIHGSQLNRIKMKRLYYDIRNSFKFINKYLDRKQRLILIPSLTIVRLYDLIKNYKTYISTSSDKVYLIKLILSLIKSNVLILKPSDISLITPPFVKNRYYYHFMESVVSFFKSNELYTILTR